MNLLANIQIRCSIGVLPVQGPSDVTRCSIGAKYTGAVGRPVQLAAMVIENVAIVACFALEKYFKNYFLTP